MNIISASATIENPDTFASMSKYIENAARTCYKSTAQNPKDNSQKLIQSLIDAHHEAMLEFGGNIIVRFIVDRGVSHEIVRHRLASFAQESTRYCNYAKDKFGNELTFIKPCFFTEHTPEYLAWSDAMKRAESTYLTMIEWGVKPEEARSVLPMSVKTELVVSMNPREWRHFFKLRACDATGKAHPQMKEISIPLLKEFQTYSPAVFGDLEV